MPNFSIGALHYTNTVLLREEMTYLNLVMQLKHRNRWKTYQQNVVISLKLGNVLSCTFLERSTSFQFQIFPASKQTMSYPSVNMFMQTSI